MPEQSIWTMQGFSIGTAQCVLLPEPTVDYYIELYVGFTRLLWVKKPEDPASNFIWFDSTLFISIYKMILNLCCLSTHAFMVYI